MRRGSAADLLVRALPGTPLLTITTASDLIGRSFQATSHAIDRLVEAGILKQVTVGRRNRAFEAPELIEAFTALERQLASPEGDTPVSEPIRRVPHRSRWDRADDSDWSKGESRLRGWPVASASQPCRELLQFVSQPSWKIEFQQFRNESSQVAALLIAHNLARWTARIGLAEGIVTTKTLRRRLFAVAGRLTRSARQLTLHLPARWPWAVNFTAALARLRAIPLPT